MNFFGVGMVVSGIVAPIAMLDLVGSGAIGGTGDAFVDATDFVVSATAGFFLYSCSSSSNIFSILSSVDVFDAIGGGVGVVGTKPTSLSEETGAGTGWADTFV
jgi:hypothetical protein